MNDKTIKIFQEYNLMPFVVKEVVVKRTKSLFSLLRGTNKHDYFQLKLLESENLITYDWIDFERSDIRVSLGENYIDKLSSHELLLEYVNENRFTSHRVNEIYASNLTNNEKRKLVDAFKTYSFQTKTLVFNSRFDKTIDLFRVPFYSWGTYVSQRLKDRLIKEEITDISFSDNIKKLNPIWRPHYPNIIIS